MRWVQGIAGLTVTMLVAVAAPARAVDVSFSVSSYETYVGVPVELRVKVDKAEDHDPPVVPGIDGAEVVGPSASQQRYMVNGRIVEASVTYTYQIIPRRAGKLRVPVISVVADGETRKTKPVEITVMKSDTGDLMFVEITGEQERVYIGEPVDVTLEIWLKPFKTRRVRLDERDMWNLIDNNGSSWGVFAEVLQGRNVKVRRDVRRDDDSGAGEYFVYVLEQRVWPERAGVLDAGDVSIVVQYPLRVKRNRFSLLGPEFSVSEARPISAQVESVPVEVLAPPPEGQPDIYLGAVGQYSMRVSATPTDVYVGDPITLNIEIRGTGRLDLLPAPPLAVQPQLVSDFRVPDEKLAGVVEENVKHFSQSIRAKHENVTEIPPIAFAYFDPQEERYETLHSDPIPISVQRSSQVPVTQMVEGVTPDGERRTSLTMVRTGLLANYDDIEGMLSQQAPSIGPGGYGVLAGGPLVYAACAVLQWRRRRDTMQVGLARRRKARKNAMAALPGAENGVSEVERADRVAAAITGYVADRANLPPGVARGDAVALLRSRGVDGEVVTRVDALLADCETMQYAGSGAGGDGGDLARRARGCIDELERARL